MAPQDKHGEQIELNGQLGGCLLHASKLSSRAYWRAPAKVSKPAVRLPGRSTYQVVEPVSLT
jgi:hypothetical protein